MIDSHDTANRLKAKTATTRARKVQQYTLEGKPLKTFDSLAAAARYLQEQGIAPKAVPIAISAAAQGKLYSAYGHRWSFTGEPLPNATAKNRGLQRRGIEMYTLEGKHLKSFESCMAAVQYLQKTGKAPRAAANNIGKAAQGKYYNAYGHRWSYKDEPLANTTAKSSPKTRAVEMLTLEGKHLKTFSGCNAAARYLQEQGIAPKAAANNIGKAARGKLYSAYGHRWIYKVSSPLKSVGISR